MEDGAVAADKPLVEVLREAKEAKEAAFQEGWRQMKTVSLVWGLHEGDGWRRWTAAAAAVRLCTQHSHRTSLWQQAGASPIYKVF